jgi:hypothetical protein
MRIDLVIAGKKQGNLATAIGFCLAAVDVAYV